MKELQRILSDKTKRILFTGIGNALKSDDGIGIYICRNIQEKANIETLIVESGIEKFVGKINSIAPDILILVDCTDLQEEPGHWDLISLEKVLDFTMNTHTISVKRISEFFKMEKYLLGIQPLNVKYGEEFSLPVKNTAEKLIELINLTK
ncbi:hydrogenase maturation protease [Candidatus Cloacimonadota bacterium]